MTTTTTATATTAIDPVEAVVRAFLANDGWDALDGEMEGYPTIVTAFEGTLARWQCVIRLFPGFGQVAVESVVPLPGATTETDIDTAPVHELITRMNTRLLTGAFQFDLDSSEVRFRTGVLLPDGELLAPAVFKGVLYGNVLTVDRCHRELVDVARQRIDVATAMRRLAL